jgi:hypothetical protein
MFHGLRKEKKDRPVVWIAAIFVATTGYVRFIALLGQFLSAGPASCFAIDAICTVRHQCLD